MAALWIQERGDEAVWHHAIERVEPGWYRMSCRSEMRLSEAAGIWPQKRDEAGPSVADRCQLCVGVDDGRERVP